MAPRTQVEHHSSMLTLPSPDQRLLLPHNDLQRALVQSDEGQPLRVIPNHPVPEPTPDHILVKVKAVTLNPTDWKVRPAVWGNG